MKRKKIVLIGFILIMTFSILTSCGESDFDNSINDKETSDVESLDKHQDDSDAESFDMNDKTVTLVELSSKGEIPYEYFNGGFFSYKTFNSYRYGNYADYFDTELFPYLYNSKYGFSDAEGNVVISERYDWVNLFSENKAFVRIDTTWKIIDLKGNELFTVPSGYDCNDALFQNGKAIITDCSNDLSILIIDENMRTKEIKKDGGNRLQAKAVNTPEFSGVFVYRLMSYSDSNSLNGYRYDYIYTLYDTVGNEIWSVTVPDNNAISDKLFDSLGNSLIISQKIDVIDTFIVRNSYLNVVNENGKWGLLDIKTGEIVIACNYDFVGPCSEGVVPVCRYGKWGYVDVNGNDVISPSFSFTGEFTGNRAFAISTENKPVVIDRTGKIIEEYDTSLDSVMNQFFPFSAETGISVIVRGRGSYEYSFTFITSTGQTLLNVNDCRIMYLSNKYIFVDGKMYKIVK
ncbi:MAG: WG repeat-containing protein [Clostridia bacterium]|nr:WG repeat-containing protein [Clostridia bacterium]